MKQKRERSKGVLTPLIFIALAIAVTLCSIGAASAATTVEISPSAKTVNNSDMFTLYINVTPDEPIRGVQCDLSFNQSLVTVNSVTEGNLLNQGGATTLFSKTIDNTTGTVDDISCIIYPTGTVSSPGTFAIINLTADAANAGNTGILLLDVKVSNATNKPVSTSTVNGSITVGVPAENLPPNVSVVYPDGGEVLTGTVTVNATASDSDGTVTNVEFQYSGGGAGWTHLCDDSTSPYACSWDTTLVPNATDYQIKAIATDDDGATAEDTSDATFTIANVPTTTIVITPSSKNVGNSVTFTLNITVNPIEPIRGVQCDLSFNQSLVTVNSVTEGNLLNQGGATTLFSKTIDNTTGTVDDISCIIYPTGTVSSPGTFAIINLTADVANAGNTDILLLDVKVSNATNKPVSTLTVNGSVTVGEAEGPTIVSYTITPPTITPPQTTEIDVEFSERVSYSIAIEKDTATIYDWTGTAKDPNAKVWAGTYTNGTDVPAGVYTVNVSGTNTTTGLSVVDNTKTITVEVLAPQVPVSDADGGLEPDIALGSTGNIYVAFEDDYIGIDFAKSTDGIIFSTPIFVAGSSAWQYTPAIAAYGENNVYAVWLEDYKIYYARSTNGGDSFGTKVQVSDAGGCDGNPDIAVNSNTGAIYVVWDGDENKIYIDKSTDGTTFDTDVSVNDSFSVVGKPSIAIDSNDNILVAWDGRISGMINHVYLAKSTDGGATFNTPVVRVDDSGSDALCPSVVVDPADSNKVYVAWEDARAADGGDIYAAASTDGGAIFGTGVKVNDDTTNTAQKFPCMAVNSSGAIFVVWQDGRNYTSSDYDVYFAGSTDGGSTFSENRKVNPAGTKAVTPTLTVDDTNAFVAWRNTDDNRIYFRKGVLSEWTAVPIEESVNIILKAGWNMVSVPVIPEDTSVGTVFPGVTAVYAYNTTARNYEIPTNVETCKGYWVAVAGDETITVSGTPVSDCTVSLTAGWNIIGSVMCDVSIEDPEDVPDGSVQIAYGYNTTTRSYETTTTIEPTKGYWVATTQDCTLRLACT